MPTLSVRSGGKPAPKPLLTSQTVCTHVHDQTEFWAKVLVSLKDRAGYVQHIGRDPNSTLPMVRAYSSLAHTMGVRCVWRISQVFIFVIFFRHRSPEKFAYITLLHYLVFPCDQKATLPSVILLWVVVLAVCIALFDVLTGAGLLIGQGFFHFNKGSFCTFYSMHFFLDSACCQEEMHAVKCTKKA